MWQASGWSSQVQNRVEMKAEEATLKTVSEPTVNILSINKRFHIVSHLIVHSQRLFFQLFSKVFIYIRKQ